MQVHKKYIFLFLCVALALVSADVNISLKKSFSTNAGFKITGVYPAGNDGTQSLYIVSDIKGTVYLYGVNYNSDSVRMLSSLAIGSSITYLRTFNGKFYAQSPEDFKVYEITVSNTQLTTTKALTIPSKPICFHFISSKLIVAAEDGRYYLFDSSTTSILSSTTNMYMKTFASCSFRSMLDDSQILFFFSSSPSAAPDRALKLTLQGTGASLNSESVIFQNLAFADIGMFPKMNTFALYNLNDREINLIDMNGSILKRASYPSYSPSSEKIVRKWTFSGANHFIIFADGPILVFLDYDLNLKLRTHTTETDDENLSFLLPSDGNEVHTGSSKGKVYIYNFSYDGASSGGGLGTGATVGLIVGIAGGSLLGIFAICFCCKKKGCCVGGGGGGCSGGTTGGGGGCGGGGGGCGGGGGGGGCGGGGD